MKKGVFTMQSMKKLAALVLAAATMLSFAACGGSDDASQSDTGSFDTAGEISVVSREDGSGTRGAFIELFGIEEKDADGNKTDHTTDNAIISNKTDVMLANIAQDPQAIGYVSLGSLNDTVKVVSIDGVEASTDNVKNGTYSISRPFNIAVGDAPSALAKDFISYIMSSEGQAIVEENGYIAVDDTAAAYSGTKPQGKLVIGGSSSVSPVMEKLVEAYQAVNSGAEIEVQTSDSTAGVTACMEGTCDIAMASRELKESESLTATAIALDGIAVIVNNDNPLTDMTTEQVKSIYIGDVTTWDTL